jgi:hypothetical protein
MKNYESDQYLEYDPKLKMKSKQILDKMNYVQYLLFICK